MKSVCIFHNDIYVTFHSTNNEEINAIKNCFSYFWTVKDSSNVDESWSIVSHQVSSVKDIIDVNELTLSIGLFRYAPVKSIIINKKHYYAHDPQNLDTLTCFDLESKTTHFYHEHKLKNYSYIRNLVREPIVAQYEESGYIALHASACSINNKGIMIPGFRDAGKSTLLCHLLERGANYIGNDYVLCKKENDSIILTTVPQCVRLSEETIQNNNTLSRYFNDTSCCVFFNNKIEFLPSLFDNIYPMHHLSSISKLELIIFPSINLSSTDYSIEISDNNSWLPLLQQSIFNQYHNYIWSPFFHKLNDPLIDISNFINVFNSTPKICYLNYGILDYCNQKKLFDDILNIIC